MKLKWSYSYYSACHWGSFKDISWQLDGTGYKVSQLDHKYVMAHLVCCGEIIDDTVGEIFTTIAEAKQACEDHWKKYFSQLAEEIGAVKATQLTLG